MFLPITHKRKVEIKVKTIRECFGGHECDWITAMYNIIDDNAYDTLKECFDAMMKQAKTPQEYVMVGIFALSMNLDYESDIGNKIDGFKIKLSQIAKRSDSE